MSMEERRRELLNDAGYLSSFGSSAGLSCGSEFHTSAALSVGLGSAFGARQVLGGGRHVAAAVLALGVGFGGLMTEAQAGAQYVSNSTGYDMSAGFGNSVFVNSTGSVNRTHVHSGGSQTLTSNGAAYYTVVSSAGTEIVSSGGTANYTTLQLSGVQIVSSAGIANATTAGEGGSQVIMSAGEAKNAIIYGSQIVSRGGVASSTQLKDGGYVLVNSAASAMNNIMSGGQLHQLSGGVVSALTATGGSHVVDSAVFTDTLTVYKGDAKQLIVSGGSAIGQTFTGGAEQHVMSGLASAANISSGGKQIVFDGGVASANIIGAGGFQDVSSGGTAIADDILAGASQIVFSGGSAVETKVAGAQYIQDGGIASRAVVQGTDAIQYIYAGGSADSTVLSNGATLWQRSDGVATNLSMVNNNGVSHVLDGASYSGGSYIGNYQYVQNGGSALSATIADTGVQYLEDGFATSTFVNQGGSQVVTGGIADNAIVSGANAMQIFSGGSGFNNIISAGAKQEVYADATVTSTTVFTGGVQDVRGGLVEDTAINAGGTQNLYAGKALRNVVSGAGATENVSGGTATSTTVMDQGTQNVFAGGFADKTFVSSGGTQAIAGGSALDATVISGGAQTITAGTATSTKLNGGTQTITSTGVAEYTQNSGGQAFISNGGLAISGTVFGNGRETVGLNGVASATTVQATGSQTVANGGKALNTKLDGATALMTVNTGGSATDLFITAAGGSANITGSLTNATINGGEVNALANGVLRGAYNLNGLGRMNIGGTEQEIDELKGNGGMVNMTSAGQLTVNQSTDTTYAGTFSDSTGGDGGTLIKTGNGELALTNGGNAGTLTSLNVNGGEFLIGDKDSTGTILTVVDGVDVNKGGLFGGFGTVTGDVRVADGGTLSTLGGLTVDGHLGVRGLIEAVVSPNGATDTIKAKEATVEDGTVVNAVFKPALDYGSDSLADLLALADGPDGVNWDIVQVTGGGEILGSDGNTLDVRNLVLDDDIAGLMFYSAELDVYDTLNFANNTLGLSLNRKNTFSDFGDTFNENSVGVALESLPTDSDLYRALNQMKSDVNINQLYNEMSGEIYAGLAGSLMQADRAFAQSMLNRTAWKAMTRNIFESCAPVIDCGAYGSLDYGNDSGNGIWAEFGYAHQQVDGDGNGGRSTLKGPEVSVGYDKFFNSGFILGGAFRYADRDYKLNTRRSDADIDSFSFDLHAGYQTQLGSGKARFMAGGIYTRHNVDTNRYITEVVPQRLRGDYNIDSWQVYLEGAYTMEFCNFWFEPFVDVMWNSTHSKGFTESSSATGRVPSAALRVNSETRHNISHVLGARAIYAATSALSFEAQAGWRHTYGTLDKSHSYNFIQGSNNFNVRGASINRDEALIDLRATYRVRDNMAVGIEGNAAIGNNGHTLRGGAFIAIDW